MTIENKANDEEENIDIPSDWNLSSHPAIRSRQLAYIKGGHHLLRPKIEELIRALSSKLDEEEKNDSNALRKEGGGLAQMEDDITPDDQNFLNAWKRGVEIAGREYFACDGVISINDATDKNQLRPNSEIIDAEIVDLSTGESIFLAAMCSFYSWSWARELFEKAGLPSSSPGYIFSRIDLDQRDIIADLGLNYVGW